jgi:hypothetical protein
VISYEDQLKLEEIVTVRCAGGLLGSLVQRLSEIAGGHTPISWNFARSWICSRTVTQGRSLKLVSSDTLVLAGATLET